MAAAISYHLLFSLFPLVIVVVSILGLVLQNDRARAEVVEWLLDAAPLSAEAGRSLERAVAGIASPLSAAGLVALAGLAWSASAVVGATRAALASIWEEAGRRPLVRGKALDLALVGGAGLLVLASFALTVAVRLVQRESAEAAGGLGAFGRVVEAAGEAVGVVLPLALTFATFLLLLHLLPPQRPSVASAWPGALVAALGFETVKHGFALYLAHFADYNVIYGSLGAVVAFLFFVYLGASAFLLGAEVVAAWPGAAVPQAAGPSQPLRRRALGLLARLWRAGEPPAGAGGAGSDAAGRTPPDGRAQAAGRQPERPSGQNAPMAPGHPLDPLSPEEIRAAAACLRRERRLPASARFVEVSLREPDKSALAAGGEVEREAFLSVLDPETGTLSEAIVSLPTAAVRSFREVPGALPPILPDEYEELVRALKADARYRAALARRSIEDLELVSVDAIPAGCWDLDEDRLGRRFVRALSFVRPEPLGSAYARHVEGVVAFVDLDRMEVFRVDDHGVVPLPPDEGEYRASRLALRTDLRPLEIVQPEGPSFEVDGHEVRWQRWRFRIGFTLREGLVLHQVRYEDGGGERSVLHRASYTELAVPYGHPGPTHFHQCVLDLGEQQFGALANALELGCDCLGEIRYLDAVVNDSRGEPVVLRNAVCLHEEDQGLLWKHVDARTGLTEVRRLRRLVVSWIATTGNYEYAFYWYLYQDGSIESEVKLTGILQTMPLAPGEPPAHGELVAPRVNGMLHQHIFNVRLDLDVDGVENTVYETSAERLPPGEGNPHGNAFATRAVPLETEAQARREVDQLSARSWKVVNPAMRNALGEPVGYRLVPGDNARAMVDPDSPFARRTGFVRHHLWVTPYEPSERYATGDYPVQHPGGAGLPEWTAADRPIAGRDVVLWYTFAHHHVPRPEDWPVMPVARIGFALRPAGFFDRNPALDVPPPPGHGRCHGPAGE